MAWIWFVLFLQTGSPCPDTVFVMWDSETHVDIFLCEEETP